MHGNAIGKDSHLHVRMALARLPVYFNSEHFKKRLMRGILKRSLGMVVNCKSSQRC